MIDLGTLRAQDVMKTELVSVTTRSTLTEAVRTFEENGVSGAPVVDDSGDLVGVLSWSDIGRSEHFRDQRFEGRSHSAYEYDPLLDLRTADELEESGILAVEDYDPEALSQEQVETWMTPRLVSVTRDTSVAEICALMSREAIHRVFVVDGGRLEGVVSSFDIVRAIGESETVPK